MCTSKNAIRCVLVLALSAVVPAAHADEVHFDFESNSLGTYPMNSGAVIDFEMYVSILDVEGDGYAGQGIQGFEGSLLSDTGSPAFDVGAAATTVGGSDPDYPTIAEPAWISMNRHVGGFGMGFFTNLGTTVGDDVFGIGFFGTLEWDADVDSSTAGNQPYSLAGVGIGSPLTAVDSGGNPLSGFLYGGSARDKWYLVAASIAVPAAPGTYTVSWQPGEGGFIRGDHSPFGAVDLNNDILNGYIESVTWTSTRHGGSFSFTVTPEPATISAVLLAAAGLVARRRR